MKPIDPLKHLSRNDKWYVGGGNRLIWAPLFPQWLDFPGLWDEAHYYNYELKPVFTWTILNENGEEIQLERFAEPATRSQNKPLPKNQTSRTWNPASLTTIFRSITQLKIQGKTYFLPGDNLCTEMNVENPTRKIQKIHFIVWTAQETSILTQDHTKFDNNTMYFKRTLSQKNPFEKNNEWPELNVDCAFQVHARVKSYCVQSSEGSTNLPYWKLTPFVEKFQKDKLPNTVQTGGVTYGGLTYMAMHVELTLKPRSVDRIVTAFTAAPTTFEVNENLAIGNRYERRGKATETVAYSKTRVFGVQAADMMWKNWFNRVPYFECTDAYLTKYYWHRWYGLRLNSIDWQSGNVVFPAICGGIGPSRAPISRSAVAHMLETRWMHEPSYAQGSILNFIENQLEDGNFHGYLDTHFYRPEISYIADWGKGVHAVHTIHPDPKFLNQVYQGLKKYSAYFDRNRDIEKSGLYDIRNPQETGQEFMSRYLMVDPKADQDPSRVSFKLKSVDATVSMFELKKNLVWMAGVLGEAENAEKYRGEAEKIKKAVQEKMWDGKENMFFDVNPKSGERINTKAAVNFYPYATDIVDSHHLTGLFHHLFNPREFWTKYPVPSSGVGDILFSPEPEWKGMRMNRPWNGRVWPMANSHLAEALGTSSSWDPSLRKRTVEFIGKYIRMMFLEGDLEHPNCFEHYNPYTGQPSLYRGMDDTMDSWVADLIIKYVAGVRPELEKVIFDPFPFALQNFVLDQVKIHGSEFKVERNRNKFSVWQDGKLFGNSIIGEPLVVEWK